MSDDGADPCGRARSSPQHHVDGRTAPAAAASASCPCAVTTSGRRALVAAGVGLGVAFAARMAGAQSDAAHARPQQGDLLVKVGDTTPLGPDSLLVGASQIMTWPMDPAENVVRD